MLNEFSVSNTEIVEEKLQHVVSYRHTFKQKAAQV